MTRRIMSLLAAMVLLCTMLNFGAASAATEEKEDLLQLAMDLGIIDESMQMRADKNIKETEVPAILQAVFVHGYGRESTYLNQMKNFAEKGRDASRYWFAMGIFYPYCEFYYDKTPEDAWAFMDEMDQVGPSGPFGQFDSCNYGIIHKNKYNGNPNVDEGMISGGAVWDLLVDSEVLFEGGSFMEWRHDFGNWWVAQLSFTLYDRVTGEKVLDMDAEQKWNPVQKMTIRDAAEAAVRYWRFFEEPAVKVAFADAGTYDTSIITDELLHKETTLPANSCKHLPAEWHGILWDKWNWVAAGAIHYNFDRVFRQEDVQILKDAGLNVARMLLSFSWLQTPDVTAGQVNETRLKQLDEVLALCMKNDIHLMLACTQIQDVSEWANFYEEYERSGPGPVTDQEIQSFTAFWQMLARRYADIPNEYLSFNLYNEIHLESEEEYERVLGPAVDAIRAVSQDRTIIANIHTGGLTGESMAKRGVALSYHLYDPMDFVYINKLGPEKMTDANYMHSVTWPFTENGKKYDASVLLDTPLHYMPNASSINSMRALAAQYDVGFMVTEFGPFGEYKNGMATVRYTDETLFGYYQDIIETFEKEGIGWVRGQLAGTWGLVVPYPAVEGVQYEKVGLYYVDTGFRDLLKSFEK
ncbi:MAG: cellulase family glycosylhydrolase [Clostridia bacterium]